VPQETTALLKGEWRAANPNDDDPELEGLKMVTAALPKLDELLDDLATIERAKSSSLVRDLFLTSCDMCRSYSCCWLAGIPVVWRTQGFHILQLLDRLIFGSKKPPIDIEEL